MKKIILASSSPRRKELLATIISDFDIVPSNIEETYPSSMDLFEIPLYISNLKALDIYNKYPSSIVIGCDTAIVFKDKLIGKPKDKDDAKQTLLEFSNNYHYVVSGVTIYSSTQKYEINSINKVYFKNISINDIEEYLSNDEYKDKAGSYAIQGLASKFIDKIEGEFEAIVGLPIKELLKILKSLIK